MRVLWTGYSMVALESGLGLLLSAAEAVRLELLLFAGFWFVIGALDELAIDVAWLWLKSTGRARTHSLDAPLDPTLIGPIALYVPAWREARVIGPMLRHALAAWPHDDLRIYAGCYVNDPETFAAIEAAGTRPDGTTDPRLTIVVNERPGPTTKGDCLNRCYAAMLHDEQREGRRFRAVLLHDAEDLVHPQALSLIDRELERADSVQIPVRPERHEASQWVSGHYCDEFTDAHAREMVVRAELGAGIPAAGVGCAFSRGALDRIIARRGSDAGPFDPTALTEDYELGMLIGRAGAEGKGDRFVRVRASDGSLIATSAYFPHRLDAAVRQKARWVQGIAFDGWEQLGWSRSPLEFWMRLRDRRGPLVAVVLLTAYLLIVLTLVLRLAEAAGIYRPARLPPLIYWVLILTTLAFVWRGIVRFLLVGREYGWSEGLAAIIRIPVANIIAIISARRALGRYVADLRGKGKSWDKTEHDRHPAEAKLRG
jgi:adsorption protein B